MKKCNHCNIPLNTERKTCPLCKEMLVETNETTKVVYQPFPKFAQEKKKVSLPQRLLIFITIIIFIVMVVINYYTFIGGDKSLWSLIIITSILVVWAIVRGLIISRANLGKRLFWFGIALLILFYTIDYFLALTPNNYNYNITDFATPFILIGLVLVLDFACILKKVYYRDYLGYLLSFCFLCLIPKFLYWIGLSAVSWPSTVALIFACCNFLALFFLAFDETVEELKKRFYI